MKKKLLGLIFMVLLVCTVSFSASADKCFRPGEDLSGKCGENVYYNYSKETKELIISGEGDMYDYGTYDSEIGESPISEYIFDKVTIMDGVTSIGDRVFYCSDIYNTSLSLPNSITKIGEYAFYACYGLSDIVIPDSVQSIGKYAFAGCSITKATIPDGVTIIEEGTFAYTYLLTSISIPDSVESIGRSAFENSNLTSIYIPDSVTSMSANVFNGTPYYNDESNWENGLLYIDNHLIGAKDNIETCYIKDSIVTIADNLLTYLRTNAFVVGENCKYFSADDRGALFDKNKTRLIKYPTSNPATSYIIPEGVLSVDEYAFYGSGVKSVVIADSVTDIGYAAFTVCMGLECVYFGSGLKKINHAFDHCYNIKEIHCSDIDMWMNLEWDHYHEECWWEKVDYYFNGVLTKNLIIPDGYEEITGVFNFGSFTSVTIPASVKNIGWQFNGSEYITHIYYCGTEAQWNNIEIYPYNSILNATIVFDWLNHVHSYKSEVIVPATHFSVGKENMVCICGDSYTQDIPKVDEHKYNAVTTAPTCTAQGFTTYTCDCGVSYKDNYVSVLEHIDYDGDYKCDFGCGYEFEKPAPEEPAEPEEEKNFIEKLIEWLKEFFNFDWLKKLFR